MFSFRRFDRSTTLFVGLLTVSFLVATFDVRANGEGVGNTMREGAQVLFSPLQQVATAVTRPVVGFIDGVSDIAGLRDENERLRDQVRALQQQLQDTQSLEAQRDQLQAIIDWEPPGELATVTARIFSLGVSDFDHIRWIDRGSDDGITVGQTVTDEDGLIGSIDLVTEGSARVRLITDIRFGVGVRNRDTNELGTVIGQGSSAMQLRMFNALQPVEQGQLLVTDGTKFPAGIAVGTVTRAAETEAGFLLETTVTPSINVSEIDFVKVIVGYSPLDAADERLEDEQTPGGDRPITER